MDMFVVGVYKNKNGNSKNIQGFKVLAIKSDNTMETRDVPYDSMYNVLSSGKAVMKNLKLEGKELKGINGSLDRYGVVGKSQALVILKEIQDGNKSKYFCSDSSGITRVLSEEQVLQFADKFGIANGKVVPNEKGVRHISAIEGNYDISRATQTKQTTQTTQKQNTLPNDVLTLLNNIKQRPEYSGSYAERIATSVEKSGKCTDRQKHALERIYNAWVSPVEVPKINNNDTTGTEAKSTFDPMKDISGISDEVKNLIDELKQYKKYKGSFAEKVVKYVETYNKCSDKQLDSLKKEKARLEALENKQPATQQQPAQQQPAQQQPVTQPTATQTNTQPSTTVAQPQTTNNNQASASEQNQRKLAKLDRSIKEESTKYSQGLTKEKVEQARMRMSAKERRTLNKNIKSDGLFDYSLTKEKKAYVEGFTSKAEIVLDVVIPETVTIDNITYRVTGISIGAFSTEKIKSIKTSKNINDIGSMAFSFCEYLETADLSESKHTLIPSSLFNGCTKLSEVEIGSYVEKIHEFAFRYCNALKTISLPETCTAISRCAFEWCGLLQSCIGSVKQIDYGVFYNCMSLKAFNFSTVLSIGPQAFRKCGFEELVIDSNVGTIGEKAFADNYLLQKVTLEEGVREIGDFCFAKSEFASASDETVSDNEKAKAVRLDELYAPKSLTTIGIDAFRNVGLVIGWTGTIAESKCINFGTPFKRLDAINNENSTIVRIKSEFINANPIKTLKNELEKEEEKASNPDFELRTDKLVNIAFNESQLAFLNIPVATEVKEPHIKFKAAVNYLQDMQGLFQAPLTSAVLRSQETYYVLSEQLYDDDCNKIYKMTYQIMDTMEEGKFIIVFMNNVLRYMTDCNLYTDMIMNDVLSENEVIPVKTFLHSGDVIGEKSTISGADGEIVNKGIREERENIGLKLYNRLYDNGICVKTSKRDELLYIPADDVVINLHDKRGDNIDDDDKVDKLCKSIIEIMDYDKFISELKKLTKNIGGYEKFFNDLANMSESQVKRKIKNMATIEDEKEAQLFKLSKEFNDIVHQSGIMPNPNLLTVDIFRELSHSYWMISKDEDWLRMTGRKSLNMTAQYHIGKYKLTEYKSNQIVKFSNPYMNGCKGAYVFTLEDNSLIGVYASRYNMQYITDKLYDLTNISSKVNPDTIPESIMQNPEEIDKLNPALFYKFYDVLYSKGGWSFKSYNKYNKGIYNVEFAISMYKPNGIFYLTMTRLSTQKQDGKNKISGYMTMPILPIGNMDRALLVATTTNTNAKDTRLFDELMNLAAYQDKEDGFLRIYENGIISDINDTKEAYTQVRRMILERSKDVKAYKQLVSDRAVYMLGTIHVGQLQREKDVLDYDSIDDIEDDDIMLDDIANEYEATSTDDELDIEDDDLNLELEDDELELDLGDNDVEDDDTDEPNLSFEEFFEIAKGMGIDSEDKARVMYINFLKQQ